MTLTPINLLEIIDITSDEAASVAPVNAKVSTIVFIRQYMKVYTFAKVQYGETSAMKFLGRIKLSAGIQAKIPYIVGGWVTLSGIDGGNKSIPNPLRVITIWSQTFRECMKLSNGNRIASCLMALATTGLTFCPWFENRNQFIMVSQTMIRLAYLSVKPDINDLQTIIEYMDVLNGGAYGYWVN